MYYDFYDSIVLGTSRYFLEWNEVGGGVLTEEISSLLYVTWPCRSLRERIQYFVFSQFFDHDFYYLFLVDHPTRKRTETWKSAIQVYSKLILVLLPISRPQIHQYSI